MSTSDRKEQLALYRLRKASREASDLLSRVEAAGQLEKIETAALIAAVCRARECDEPCTWAEIGKALGVTASAAYQRFSPHIGQGKQDT